MKGGPQARVSSPALERSTLITSAPRSASTWPAHGPARMRASSSTRTPANGPGMMSPSGDNRRSTDPAERNCLELPVDRHDGAARDRVLRRSKEGDRGGDLLDLRPRGVI